MQICETDDPHAAVDELLVLVATRCAFSLNITSDDFDRWAVVLSDARMELRGAGMTFFEAWLAMSPPVGDPDTAEIMDEAAIKEMLHQASIWADLAQAAIDAESAPARDDSRYVEWLWEDQELPLLSGAEMLALPG